MNENEIKNLINGNPDRLIKIMEEKGIDFSCLDKDIARLFVKEKFNFTQDQFDAVDFIFWVSYMAEKDAEDLIIYPEVMVGARKEALEIIVEKLHFGEKISVIEKLHVGKKDEMIKLMRKIQDMRNNIAHGRFDELSYGGYHLSDNRAKIKLMANYRDVMLKKDK